MSYVKNICFLILIVIMIVPVSYGDQQLPPPSSEASVQDERINKEAYGQLKEAERKLSRKKPKIKDETKRSTQSLQSKDPIEAEK